MMKKHLIHLFVIAGLLIISSIMHAQETASTRSIMASIDFQKSIEYHYREILKACEPSFPIPANATIPAWIKEKQDFAEWNLRQAKMNIQMLENKIERAKRPVKELSYQMMANQKALKFMQKGN